jgi:hypothetical protein
MKRRTDKECAIMVAKLKQISALEEREKAHRIMARPYSDPQGLLETPFLFTPLVSPIKFTVEVFNDEIATELDEPVKKKQKRARVRKIHLMTKVGLGADMNMERTDKFAHLTSNFKQGLAIFAFTCFCCC